MRAKWALLLKIQLMGLTGIGKLRKDADPAVRRRAIGGLTALAIVGLVIVFYTVLIALSYCEQGLGAVLPSFTVAVASLIVFAFSFFQGAALLFSVKDRDFVLSLPVPRRDILVARLLCSYIVNLAFVLLIAVPVTVVYFVFEGFGPAALGTVLLAVIFAPLLPLIVGAALGKLVSALTAGMRHKNLLQSILSVVLFVGALAASFSLSFSAGPSGDIDFSAMYDVLVGSIYPPAVLAQWTLTGGRVWGVFAFAGISLAAAVIFVAVEAAFYDKIVGKLMAHAAARAYRKTDIKSASVMGALIKKEFRRLFSCPGYMLNGISGSILMAIGAVVLLFVDLSAVLPADAASDAFLTGMAAGLLIFMIGISCPAASALSLEGSSRGLLFSMPVSAQKILLAKAAPTFLINGAAGLLIAVVFCIKASAGALGWILCLLTVFLYAACFALAGIYFNSKFPKYDWTTETQVAKNSMPVMIVCFSAMVLGFAVMGLGFAIGYYAAAAADVLAAALIAVFLALLKKVKLYV